MGLEPLAVALALDDRRGSCDAPGVKDPREVRRDVAAKLGREAVQIGRDGRYVAPSGQVVDISRMVEDALTRTLSIPPGEQLGTCPVGQLSTRIRVNNESTLVASLRLHRAGLRPAALNFASARHPGGGVLTGARAQEESLARSSALYACLAGQPYYEHHAKGDSMYSSWLLYSPDVPVFRDDDGALLEEPWPCTFITGAAPMVKALRERRSERLAEVPGVMRERIARVLTVAAREGHASVVLGAWGCGAFGGDTESVAGIFKEALAGPFRGVFEEVVFAVLDTTDDRRFIGPFARRF